MAEIIASPTALPAALATLGRGECVAIPTETVYGLAADATDGAAVARIYQTKRRPRFNPLICHVADMDMARRIAAFDPLSEKIAASFWPGALTLVLPLAPGSPIHPLALAGLPTVAVRMPRGFARALIGA
ncbi:MAG: L-threonylcarbamoyladenylate synthase, partial [Rhizobiaceae bacterium]